MVFSLGSHGVMPGDPGSLLLCSPYMGITWGCKTSNHSAEFYREGNIMSGEADVPNPINGVTYGTGFDKASGRVFWTNETTKKVQWTNPVTGFDKSGRAI